MQAPNLVRIVASDSVLLVLAYSRLISKSWVHTHTIMTPQNNDCVSCSVMWPSFVTHSVLSSQCVMPTLLVPNQGDLFSYVRLSIGIPWRALLPGLQPHALGTLHHAGM